VRSEVLFTMNIKFIVFWDVRPYTVVNRNQRFGGAAASILRVERFLKNIAYSFPFNVLL
jgi:hypothetical protein